jgi:Tol biopolymer transport system component
MRWGTSLTCRLALAASLITAGLMTGPAPARASFPGRTGRIAFDDFMTGQIYAVNPDGTALVQLTQETNHYAARWPDWSPDGSHLLFVRLNTSNGMGRVWIMRSDGSGQHKVTSDAPGYRDYQPNYTPDGRHIVFPRCKPDDGVCAIWIMRSDGTDKRALTPYKEGVREAVDFFPSVSPDGRQVAYTAFGQGGITVQTRVMRIDGTHNHAISPPALEAAAPDWSPNGRRLTVSSNWARLNNNVYSMRPDGSGIRTTAANPSTRREGTGSCSRATAATRTCAAWNCS